MAPSTSLWKTSSLQRYQPFLFAFTALVAGYSIYYIYDSFSVDGRPSKNKGGLHRSNARRRRPHRRSVDRPNQRAGQPDEDVARDGEFVLPSADGVETDDADTELEDPSEEVKKDGQSLLNLLYRIAEESSRKDSFVHRGVQCNACNETPIKGIRYRCANCPDYDLCEQCEAFQIHNRTHLFYKIRIPAPYLGGRRDRQPVSYPGKPRAVTENLEKTRLEELARDTGYKIEEIEAYWEQFRCVAATPWDDDPHEYHLAIDRQTFDKCFIPTGSRRSSPPNLIHERMFFFYDTNKDGLIGFDEFIKGLAMLKKKNADERLRRVFEAYDLDNDGFVDRNDFLRMFRAYYANAQELTSEAISSPQDESDEADVRGLIEGGQPLSSAFTSSILPGSNPRAGEGKSRDGKGDDIITDKGAVVDDQDIDPNSQRNSIIADNAERARWHKPRLGASGKEIYDIIYRSPTDILAEKMKLYGLDLAQAKDNSHCASMQRRLHCLAAIDFRQRQFVRRQAVMKQMQSHFFLSKKLPPAVNLPTRMTGGVLADPRRYTPMSTDLTYISYSPTWLSRTTRQVQSLVSQLSWPIGDVTDFQEYLFAVIRAGWSHRAIVEDLDGYSPQQSEVEDFVTTLGNLLHGEANLVRSRPGCGPAKGKPAWSSIRTGDRVTSKSTMKHDVSGAASSTTDDHSPTKEILGSPDQSQPKMPDLGASADLMHQLTSDAFNELLDTVFSLREELALKAFLTKKSRKRWGSNVRAAVARDADLRLVVKYLTVYQRSWRRIRHHLFIGLHHGLGGQRFDETEKFVLFMHNIERGIRGSAIVGAHCPQCRDAKKSNWVMTTEKCHECGFIPPPAIRKPEYDKARSEGYTRERCSHCLKPENDVWITGEFCDVCGAASHKLLVEEDRIRSIIANGGDLPADARDTSSSKSASKGKKDRVAKGPESTCDAANDANAQSNNAQALEQQSADSISSSRATPGIKDESSDDTIGFENVNKSAVTDSGGAEQEDMAEESQILCPTGEMKAFVNSEIQVATLLGRLIVDINGREEAMAQRLVAVHSLPVANRRPYTWIILPMFRDYVKEVRRRGGPITYENVERLVEAREMQPYDPTLPHHRPNRPLTPTNLQQMLLPLQQMVPSSQQTVPSPQQTLTPSSTGHINSSSLIHQGDSYMSANATRSPFRTPDESQPAAMPHAPYPLLNRPNLDLSSPDFPLDLRYKLYAALAIIEAEDRERGGPGRLNFEEFEDVMRGAKGPALGFLMEWVHIGVF